MARELVRYLVSNLVDHPEDLNIRDQEAGDRLRIHVSVHPGDRDVLLGDGGSTVRALRTIVRAAGEVRDRRFQLEIEE